MVSTRNARMIRRGIMLGRAGAGDVAGRDKEAELEILQKLNRAGVRAWGRTRFPGLALKVQRKVWWGWW